jgi:Zn-dependent protease with chaperone function
MSDVLDWFINLISNALRHVNHHYTGWANGLLNKVNVEGYIIVSNYKPRIPQCGLACSMGVGGVGLIFIEKSFFENKHISEELKKFIIAHELAHITQGHLVATLFTKVLVQMNLNVLKETVVSTLKSKGFLETIFGMLLSLYWFYGLLELTKIDIKLVREQELEADSLAVQLAGCEGARYFIELLEVLKEQGYDVSHEGVLGLPALTIKERLDNLQLLCRTPSPLSN